MAPRARGITTASANTASAPNTTAQARTWQAISFSDLALIQGLVMLFALIYVTVGFAVDVVHALLDPRVRVH